MTDDYTIIIRIIITYCNAITYKLQLNIEYIDW